MAEQHFVSIIINNFNYGLFLERAIKSALDQTYRHKEVIIIDDGSTDNSRKIIEKYSQTNNIIPYKRRPGFRVQCRLSALQRRHRYLPGRR